MGIRRRCPSRRLCVLPATVPSTSPSTLEETSWLAELRMVSQPSAQVSSLYVCPVSAQLFLMCHAESIMRLLAPTSEESVACSPPMLDARSLEDAW